MESCERPEGSTRPRVQRFTDLIAWQKARCLRAELVKRCRQGELRKEFHTVDQIKRAALSVMANIAEGFGRSGPREFHRSLSHSLGSCTELQSHLYAVMDEELISTEEFAYFDERAREVERITWALRDSISRRISELERESKESNRAGNPR